MKTRFYDKPPDICTDLYETDYRDFKQEINFIAHTLDILVSRIRVDGNHPVGEDVIFIDDIYNGYLDQEFYDFMLFRCDPYEKYKDWIDKWRIK